MSLPYETELISTALQVLHQPLNLTAKIVNLLVQSLRRS